jgi:hypothetical protein
MRPLLLIECVGMEKGVAQGIRQKGPALLRRAGFLGEPEKGIAAVEELEKPSISLKEKRRCFLEGWSNLGARG